MRSSKNLYKYKGGEEMNTNHVRPEWQGGKLCIKINGQWIPVEELIKKESIEKQAV